MHLDRFTLRGLSALTILALLPLSASAHGPTPQKVEESVDIAAPLERVWSEVKAFSRIADWNPALSASAGGDAVGGQRTLTFSNGQTIVEGLDEADEAEHGLRYRLVKENPAAFAVGSHFSRMRLSALPAGHTRVQWTSRFYRADSGNEPPEDLNDEAAVRAMSDFMRRGLDGLKAKLESD